MLSTTRDPGVVASLAGPQWQGAGLALAAASRPARARRGAGGQPGTVVPAAAMATTFAARWPGGSASSTAAIPA